MTPIVWITLPVTSLPGYRAWSKQKSRELPALIARLDAREITLPRPELRHVSPSYFEELLSDLLWSLESVTASL